MDTERIRTTISNDVNSCNSLIVLYTIMRDNNLYLTSKEGKPKEK